MSRRKLTPDERALWSRVSASVAPLSPDGRRGEHPPPAHARLPEHPDSAVNPVAVPRHKAPKAGQPVPPAADLTGFSIGRTAGARGGHHDLFPGPAEQLAAAPVRMDGKAHRKMTRGRLEPEARLDLHGMTLSGAHPALIRFVLGAHRGGARLVLVITGKGREGDGDGPIPQRVGVLRHQVPHWLHAPPLAGVVLQVAPAHARHGGTGAYYVYLRRS